MTNQEKFLEKAKAKFGDKFDYSKVDYIDSKTPVCIICPKHGEFLVKPVNFIQSKWGCKKCSVEETHNLQRKTTEQFISEAKNYWGNRFSYENTKYIDSKTKIIVTCPVHGDFYTNPKDFIRGHGCPKCAHNLVSERNKNKRLPKEEFINRGKMLYGDLFSYDKTEYVTRKTKVIIHSNLLNEDFITTPDSFYRATFPQKYRGEDKKLNNFSQEYFVKLVSLMRPEYDYSKVEYKGYKEKICVICPEHGEFFIEPGNLIYNNEGCPKCNQSHGEAFVENVLKSINVDYKWQFPININNQKFIIDFCLILNNKTIFIEYNGIQHYVPIKHFGGKLRFEKQKERDNLLREYCLNNNIILLEYKYDIPFYELYDIIKDDIKQIKN